MTGFLERPSQGTSETRTVEQPTHRNRNPRRLARRAIAAIHTAEGELLAADQRSQRRAALAAGGAGLRNKHASAVATALAGFAGRRALLLQITDASVRTAALQKLAAEEVATLARLALDHAAEKRSLRRGLLAVLAPQQRHARRRLRMRQRQQRLNIAIAMRHLLPPHNHPAKSISAKSQQLRILGRDAH